MLSILDWTPNHPEGFGWDTPLSLVVWNERKYCMSDHCHGILFGSGNCYLIAIFGLYLWDWQGYLFISITCILSVTKLWLDQFDIIGYHNTSMQTTHVDSESGQPLHRGLYQPDSWLLEYIVQPSSITLGCQKASFSAVMVCQSQTAPGTPSTKQCHVHLTFLHYIYCLC